MNWTLCVESMENLLVLVAAVVVVDDDDVYSLRLNAVLHIGIYKHLMGSLLMAQKYMVQLNTPHGIFVCFHFAAHTFYFMCTMMISFSTKNHVIAPEDRKKNNKNKNKTICLLQHHGPSRAIPRRMFCRNKSDVFVLLLFLCSNDLFFFVFVLLALNAQLNCAMRTFLFLSLFVGNFILFKIDYTRIYLSTC